MNPIVESYFLGVALGAGLSGSLAALLSLHNSVVASLKDVCND